MSQWSPSFRDCQTVRSLYCINYYLCNAIIYYLCSVLIAYFPLFRQRTAARRKSSQPKSFHAHPYLCVCPYSSTGAETPLRHSTGPASGRPHSEAADALLASDARTEDPRPPLHRCCGLARHQVPVAGALAARDRAAGGNGGAGGGWRGRGRPGSRGSPGWSGPTRGIASAAPAAARRGRSVGGGPGRGLTRRPRAAQNPAHPGVRFFTAIRCGDLPWPMAGQNGQKGLSVSAAQASTRAACHPRHVSRGNAAIQLRFLRTQKRARDFV